MLVIAWPSEKTKSFFYQDKNVIFLDSSGLWFYSSSGRRTLERIEGPISAGLKIDIKQARLRINWWAPIWERWFHKGSSYQSIREKALISVVNLYSKIKIYDVNAVIVHTSIPHHLDTALLSCACELAGVKQIYLYAEVVEGRLLPVLQENDVRSRVALGLKVSDYSYSESISAFIENNKSGLPPENNTKIKAHNFSFYYAIFYLIGMSFYRKIRRLSARVSLEKLWHDLPQNDVISSWAILRAQKLFLKKLKRLYISDGDLSELKSYKSPCLLIAAQFQPEATSFPEGGDYSIHIDVILSLRGKGYGKTILYKEHPGSFLYTERIVGLTKVGIYRYPEYLDKLIELGCDFINPNYKISADESSWYVPVTITGTIAIERSLKGLHTIYTGNPFYKGLPGTIHIDDIAELKEVPVAWAVPGEETAKKAREFLESFLSNKTIVNVPGIGTGVPICSGSYDAEFEKSLRALVNWSEGS